MTTLPANTTPAPPRAVSRGLWLISPFYDLTFIIFSSVLLIVPHLAAQFAAQFGGEGLLDANVVVDILVTAFIGGPHLFATYTMTFMEPRFRARYRRYTWGALLMPIIVVSLAIANLTLLVTIFFFWASVHVIHQAAYIADSYRFKDNRSGIAGLQRAQLVSRVIDYGLLMTSLYPIATFRFTGTPLVIFGENISRPFETGGRALLFPEFLKTESLAYLATAAFVFFLVAFVVKTIWEVRTGLFHGPKTLHMSLASILFFVTPTLANLDVAFQGLNVWHSFQYLAVVLYLNRVRAERGLVGSEFVARVSKRGQSLYWLCFLFTLGAAAAYLTVRLVLNVGGIWANDPMQQHYFSFYSVVLSALLIHYYFDHFLFLQVDDVITPKWQ
ncbi:MAG: hypothetical protein HC933_16825 [Pleurocapsa sp. SU_196_0]|nr:hypothetical protein [Pleurocapsa sp. SU_196_0]